MNRRIPTEQNLKSCAVVRAWLPPRNGKSAKVVNIKLCRLFWGVEDPLPGTAYKPHHPKVMGHVVNFSPGLFAHRNGQRQKGPLATPA